MVVIYRGALYLNRADIEELKKEPEYILQRYFAIASVLIPDSNISTRKAAKNLKITTRQFNRIKAEFEKMGIPGLRKKSRRPTNSPNRTDEYLEEMVINVRSKTGFGPAHIASIINYHLEINGVRKRLNHMTVYRTLVRKGIIEAEKWVKKEWRRFEWGHPNRLIQTDLTLFNGINLLTMEDDHSRKGWALRLANAKDKTVVRGMKRLVKARYDNLLTDNGCQFNRKNKVMKEYCEKFIDEKHIWASIHHPQTLGKLSAFQKGLKNFLFHTVGMSQDKALIDHNIEVYVDFYNNGRYHTGISGFPEVRYSGKRDEEWFNKLVKGLNLGEVLTLPH